MSGLTTGATGLLGSQQQLSLGTGLSTPPGLLADVSGETPGPPGANGILQEGSLTSFIMAEDGSYILQE